MIRQIYNGDLGLDERRQPMKQDALKNIISEFNRIYHSKDDNSQYEKELEECFAKATKSQKDTWICTRRANH